MSLTWKLYNRDRELIAATRWPDEMAMLVGTRQILGDTLKRNGVTVERFDTTARLLDVAGSYDFAIGEWETRYAIAREKAASRLAARSAAVDAARVAK